MGMINETWGDLINERRNIGSVQRIQEGDDLEVINGSKTILIQDNRQGSNDLSKLSPIRCLESNKIGMVKSQVNDHSMKE